MCDGGCRSDLRHADMQQATLNAEREALRHEWRALGDARAALQVRGDLVNR